MIIALSQRSRGFPPGNGPGLALLMPRRSHLMSATGNVAKMTPSSAPKTSAFAGRSLASMMRKPHTIRAEVEYVISGFSFVFSIS